MLVLNIVLSVTKKLSLELPEGLNYPICKLVLVRSNNLFSILRINAYEYMIIENIFTHRTIGIWNTIYYSLILFVIVPLYYPSFDFHKWYGGRAHCTS